MPFRKRWTVSLAEALELAILVLGTRSLPQRQCISEDSRLTEAIVSAARGSTVQGLLQGVLEAQKGRMTVQLALFAAAATLTAVAFERENAVLFLVAGAVVPLALTSDLITKRNTLTPLLYKLGRLEMEAGEAEPFAFHFAASSPSGVEHLRLMFSEKPEQERRIRFRRYFMRRALPFSLLFYGGILSGELLLAWIFREWMPPLVVESWKALTAQLP